MRSPFRAMCASVLLALSAAPVDAAVFPTEVAAQACGAQWASVIEHQPAYLADGGAIQIDPKLTSTQTAAFNKYVATVHVLADYVGIFVGFADASTATAETLELAEAKLNLLTCLTPTDAERATIVEVAVTLQDMDEAQAHEALFNSFDQFACMRWEEASRRVFTLNPQSKTFAADFERIIEEEMRECA